MALTLGRAAGVGLLLGGGGAQYPLGGRSGLEDVTFLLSLHFIPESSLFLFLGKGVGLSLISEEFSESSSKKGFVLTGTEFVELGLSLIPSGLSGPNICGETITQLSLTVILRSKEVHQSARKMKH